MEGRSKEDLLRKMSKASEKRARAAAHNAKMMKELYLNGHLISTTMLMGDKMFVGLRKIGQHHNECQSIDITDHAKAQFEAIWIGINFSTQDYCDMAFINPADAQKAGVAELVPQIIGYCKGHMPAPEYVVMLRRDERGHYLIDHVTKVTSEVMP